VDCVERRPITSERSLSPSSELVPRDAEDGGERVCTSVNMSVSLPALVLVRIPLPLCPLAGGLWIDRVDSSYCRDVQVMLSASTMETSCSSMLSLLSALSAPLKPLESKLKEPPRGREEDALRWSWWATTVDKSEKLFSGPCRAEAAKWEDEAVLVKEKSCTKCRLDCMRILLLSCFNICTHANT
jgi:hypothetical protein